MSGIVLGWQAVDHGDAPISPLFDQPPSATGIDPARANALWRSKVEADQLQLARRHHSRPSWYPIVAWDDVHVLPVFGGTPALWSSLLVTFAMSSPGRVRMVDLTQSDLFEPVRRARGVPDVRSDVLSARGSTVDVFGRRTPEELASLVTDVLRPAAGGHGRNDALRARQELARIQKMLDVPNDLATLRDAIALLLGHPQRSITTTFDRREETELRDYRTDVVTGNQHVAARLNDLHGDLDGLLAYARDPARTVKTSGGGPFRVRTYEVERGGSTQDAELARELLSRTAMLAFSAPHPQPDLLVVAGAEELAPEVLDALTSTAQRRGKQLVLLWGRVPQEAQKVIGHGGVDSSLWARLPNRQDAEVAAKQFGKEFTFVVNGFSLSVNETDQWNESQSKTVGVTTGTTSSSGTSSSAGLKGALSFGRNFGNSVSTSLSVSNASVRGTGGSAGVTNTQNWGRVHEDVVPPETFQRLDDGIALYRDGCTAMIAVCDPAIASSGRASATPLGP
ncbi:hypothetical protein SK571_09595 [Lentzea sp. BCCO 10_0798]|uniref:Uncharacterized protein n=1 Tax=Lentzea kristufekii TaxID=3095430 RepID=A0ABU4TMW2_9PSEU|nr:hypothetical protein [Lentzea sp. BCCO 10_0798]MDX8049630.1 hypothetical protein [Lentzea sp. BCCO 10_0798]